MGKPHSRSDSLLFTSRSCTEKMFKLTFAFLLVVSGCWAQCTSDSCNTDSPATQMRVIMQQLEELRLENNKLKTTIRGLETANDEFRSTIGGLETTIGGLETTIGRLETTIDAQETTKQQFQNTIGGLETTNAELRNNISLVQTTSTELQTINEQLQTAVANLQMNVTQLQAMSTASAAYFSVAANRAEDYTYYDTIKFPVTFTNVVPAGSTGGWDAATNVYTCPITGDYMFVVTLYKYGSDSYNDFGASLTRTSLSGADTRISLLTNHKDSSVSGNIYYSSTMQAIVPCRAGEKVSVRAACFNGCRLMDHSSTHYNTFTGLKL